MKASRKNSYVRPVLTSFSQTPHSIKLRSRQISNKTAADLLGHLCELTIGFGRGHIDLTYKKLAGALRKNWSTIARAAKFLRQRGDVEVEALADRSYRWYVLLEPSDIKHDPNGVYRVRTRAQVSPTLEEVPSHAVGAMRMMAPTACQHAVDAMRVCAPMPWGQWTVEKLAAPIKTPENGVGKEPEKEPLKKLLKDTSLKKQHQSDDEPRGHKKLLEELMALGTGQRVARKLLRNHEHGLIANVLEKVRHRADLKNPVGYLIRELEDGGYEDVSHSVKLSGMVSRETSTLPSKPPLNGYERTRAELEALEAEKARKDIAYRQEVQILLQRFQELPGDLKAKLKTSWEHYLENLVPNVSKKAELMAERRFQKIAFKEVTANFFTLLDQGLSTERALAQLAA